MIRWLRVLVLRYRRWWIHLSLEIDEAQVALHTPSLERNKERLRRIDAAIEAARSPSSIIQQAMRRKP